MFRRSAAYFNHSFLHDQTRVIAATGTIRLR
jgi:hypothetical protein